MTFVDPETGEQVEVQTSRPDVRRSVCRRRGRAAGPDRDTTLGTRASRRICSCAQTEDWLTDVVRRVGGPAPRPRWGAGCADGRSSRRRGCFF